MVTEDHFGPPLAALIRGDLDQKPNKPPAHLGQLLYLLDAETLATIGVAPLLDGWARGWDWKEQSLTTVCMDVGRHFGAYIDKDLSEEDLVLADHWLVDCATTMSYFDYDAAGFPIVAPDWEHYVDACRKKERAPASHRKPRLAGKVETRDNLTPAKIERAKNSMTLASYKRSSRWTRRRQQARKTHQRPRPSQRGAFPNRSRAA
jgi:hypothetical protein